MFAEGDELRRSCSAFTESCRWAAELGCATVMSASDRGRGDPRAATNMRAAGDIAAAHRVRLAVEFNRRPSSSTTSRACARSSPGPRTRVAGSCWTRITSSAAGPRSPRSTTWRSARSRTPSSTATCREARARRQGARPMPPWPKRAVQRNLRLDRKGYVGFMSYEAPNPAAWARPADEVAREALEATRAHLPVR